MATAEPSAPPAAVVAATGAGACSAAVSLVGVAVGRLSALTVDRGRLLALSDRSSLFSAPVTGPTSIDSGRAMVEPLVGADGAPLDSEGLAVDADGTRLVTSETELSINRFAPDETLLGQLSVPPPFRVATAGAGVDDATSESLTFTPDRRELFTMNEQPLTTDHGYDRLLAYTRQAQGYLVPGAQYAYPADAGLGVPETQVVPGDTGAGTRFLVLERGYTPGVGNAVRLYLAGVGPATTDVANRSALPAGSVARPVTKSLLADLADCPPDGAVAKGPQANPTQTTRVYLLDVTVPTA